MNGSAQVQEEFRRWLRKDEGLGLTEQQVNRVALLLSVAGAQPPVPVWTTLAEVMVAPEGTIVTDSSGSVAVSEGTRGSQTWTFAGSEIDFTGHDLIRPVVVRYLPW